MKKQKSQTEITMYFRTVTPSVPASRACPSASSTCPTSATPETARPAPLPPRPQPTRWADDKHEDLPADTLPWNKE